MISGMIDLETMGTSNDCQVLTIGGVKFDPNTKDDPYDEFYCKFTLEDQEEKGRTVDNSTLDWWAKQDEKVILEAFDSEGREDTKEILIKLRKWLVGVDVIWAQGVLFDIVILESLYADFGLPTPWPFWKIKDSRTIMSLAASDPRKKYDFDAHNALADAYIQAKCVQDVVSEYGLTVRK